MNVLMTALQPDGGIRTFFRYIYGHPAFDDCVFTLVAPDEGLSGYLSEHLPPGRIEVIPASDSKAVYIKQLRNYTKSGSFDLVHSHGFSAGLLLQAAITGLKTPHLMTGHDMFTTPLFSGFEGQLKRLVIGLILRKIPAIHAVTVDAKNNILEFFPSIPEARVHPILHGIDTKTFQRKNGYDVRADIGLSSNIPLIGFFGRFMSPKGFKVLVDAIDHINKRSITELTPHVVTFGWGGFIREDYAYLEALGLKDYFHQMPQTNNMAGALKGVDVVAMPSRWEACGLLAMEALSAGVPIVGSNCIGLREVLDGSPAQQVPVGNAPALADALLAEIKNLDERREAFRAYQAEAVERFAIDHPARALAELYRQLCTKAL